MHTLTITSVTKAHSIPDATDYLDVAFEITTGKTKESRKVVHSGRHGFPIDTPEDEINASLSKLLATYLEDQERSVTNAKVESIQKQADETIQNLEGSTINHQ